MCNIFRTLRADEIEVRTQETKKSERGKIYSMLLLYKNARVDMTLLDEHFGVFGWQREHFFKDGRNYCRVKVINPNTGEWIIKEDVGTASNTEADKGQASDAFKRACVNFGIGRELYSAPRLIVELAQGEWYERDGKIRQSTKLQFSVKAIDYDERRDITAIEIVDQNGITRKKIGTINTPLFAAKAEMNATKSFEEAKAVWKKYPEFHTDLGFTAAKEMKKEQFNQ